jgi:hypothetical protein
MDDGGATQHAGRTGGWVLLLVLAVGFGSALTVRPGHTWWGMDDFSAYLMHGRNLFEGRPYGEIHTVVDPELPPSFQRKSFPPVFSSLLGLVDRATHGVSPGAAGAPLPIVRDAAGTSVLSDPQRPYGIDLRSMKQVLAGFLAAAIFAAWLAMGHSNSGAPLLLAVAAFGLSPYLYAFRELIRSEMVFVFLLYLWLDLVQRVERRAEQGIGGVNGLALLSGLVLALAYSTRTAAIVLPPALLLTDLIRARTIRRSSWITLAVAAVGILILRSVFSAVESGYMAKTLTEFSLATIKMNLQQLRWNWERIWSNGTSETLQMVMAWGSLLLVAVGFVGRLRRLTICDVFVVAYMGMIIVLPTDSAWMRYLIPVFPMFMLYMFRGARVLLGRSRGALGLGAVALLVGLSYAGAYSKLDSGPLPDGLGAPQTVETFDWVLGHTEPSDVVVFAKSRAMTLATGRPSISYPHIFEYGELSDRELWRHFEAIEARLFVLKHSSARPSNMFRMLSHSDGEILGFVARYPAELVEVFRNGEFAIYEVRGFPDVG